MNKGRNFTGKGWLKMVAQHMLNIHTEAWKARCNAIFGGPETNNKNIVSLHKQSLLMTVEQYYEKAETLPVEFRKWFDLPILKIEQLHIKPLQNWIAQTKILFRTNKINFNKENKITNYFRTGTDLNDNNNNMNNLNTIHRNKIQNNNIRNEPVGKGNEILLPKIRNIVPTKSSILSEKIISNSDTNEKNNIDKKH